MTNGAAYLERQRAMGDGARGRRRRRHGTFRGLARRRRDVKPRLVTALCLWTCLGGCSGARAGEAGVPSADTLPACESPQQAGCAECCVEQAGPTASDQSCHRRTASDLRSRRASGVEYAEAATFLNVGKCPATCRPCAACTRDRRKSYQQLLSKGCDCLDPFVRETARSIDPCFSGGCGCTCSRLSELSECGPPF
jgi:hypothetical protein